MKQTKTRVVVTGMGVLSPIGTRVETFWTSLCNGACGIREIKKFDTTGFTFTKAGEVPDPDPVAGHTRETWARLDPATRFMLAASAEALQDARWPEDEHGASETAVVASTNFGGIVSGERWLSPTGADRQAADLREYAFQTCADHVANAWHLGGPRTMLSLSCSSSTAALAYGAELIRTGRARVALTGGYDALSRFVWSGLSALRTMTKDELKPFDKTRNGTLFSEGAAVLVVEELEHAIARKATLYAEVLGYGLNNNAFHMTAPAKEGAGSAAVMESCLRDAGLKPDAVDHINAHGTGTKPNDVTETQAIKAVFGPHAAKIPVTSIKAMTGHMMGAAGSAEAVASVLTLRHGVIPPTIHYREPDPECDLDYVVNVKREQKVSVVLSNSAGIGGCNAAVILGEIYA